MTSTFQRAVADVRTYYEHNTRVFLALGRNRHQPTIHRAIWAAGVATPQQALSYINDLTSATIMKYAPKHTGEPVRVLDLGCGVGGTLLHLAQHLPMRGVGVSISAAQVRLARARAAAMGLDARCVFVEADFHDLPCSAKVDYAVAIESLVHAPDLRRVLAQAADALKPGGYLLICDDFLADTEQINSIHPDAHTWIAAFQRGWRAPGLVSRATVIALAHDAGLRVIDVRDFTPDLRLVFLPEWGGRWLFPVGRWLPQRFIFLHSLLGGLALQYCLRYGVIRYRWLVFQKQD